MLCIVPTFLHVIDFGALKNDYFLINVRYPSLPEFNEDITM